MLKDITQTSNMLLDTANFKICLVPLWNRDSLPQDTVLIKIFIFVVWEREREANRPNCPYELSSTSVRQPWLRAMHGGRGGSGRAEPAARQHRALMKALVWFWWINETLSANLVYYSDYEIGSTYSKWWSKWRSWLDDGDAMVMIKCLDLERREREKQKAQGKGINHRSYFVLVIKTLRECDHI